MLTLQISDTGSLLEVKIILGCCKEIVQAKFLIMSFILFSLLFTAVVFVPNLYTGIVSVERAILGI